MKIGSSGDPYEGLHFGKLVEERDKILSDVKLDPDKMDGFMKSGVKEDKEFKIVLDLGKLKQGLNKMTGKEGTVVEDKKTEIKFNLGSAKKAVDKLLKLQGSSLEMDNYMIPSNEGRIKHLCLTYGHSSSIKDNYREAMKTFLTHMSSAKFTILTSDEGSRKELQGYVNKWSKEGVISNPEKIKVINTGQDLSIWAQDSTLVVGDNAVQHDRMGFPGSGDWAVASEVAKANPEVKYQRMEGRFIDGGNQLATSDTLYIGSDAIAFAIRDMKRYPSKYDKIIGDLNITNAKTIGKEELVKTMIDKTFPHQKVIIVGYKGEQPAFHIDMAMTALSKVDSETGKKVITVGDPSMAIKILRDIKAKDPKKYAAYQVDLQNKVPGCPKNPLDRLVDGLKDDKALQENFDAIAKGFESDGYKIERVPYLGGTRLSRLPWFTYNNSVVDGDNIFMPNFGIPELDKAGNSIYEKYGYNVIPVDMSAISSLQGAINCITKVIERDYTAA